MKNFIFYSALIWIVVFAYYLISNKKRKDTPNCVDDNHQNGDIIELINNAEESVDLGLPSGILWATCNVGADSPEQAGLYFARGETTGYTAEQVKAGERVFDDATYQAGPAASISTNLTLEQDAARACMGGQWRMPTMAEIDELLENVTAEFISTSNNNGMLLISKNNGNRLFLPACGGVRNASVNFLGINGWYWSSGWYTKKGAKGIGFLSDGVIGSVDNSRIYGLPIRAVHDRI